MTRREWRDLGLVIGVALALRVALWWVLPRGTLISDEREYLAAADWLAHGRGFSFYAEWPWLRPPVYLLFLAPFVRLFGLNLLPIRLVQVAASLLVPALVYLLARAAMGLRVALLAGLLASLWLPLAVLPHLIMGENLFLPLLLASCWCLVRFQQELRPRWVLAGGVLLGLATLTRGLTLGFLPLAALWVLLIRRPAGARRASLVAAILLIAAALVVILPWTGYNYLRYGRLILVDTTGGYNFWLGTQGGQFHNLREVNRILLELPDPAARQTYAYVQGLGAIRADPAGFLGDRAVELGQLLRINYGADERLLGGFALGEVSVPHLLAVFLLEDTLYVLLVPLALVGLFCRKGEAGRGLVLLWLGYNLLLAVVFFAIGRFRLPLTPFLVIYAAAALVERPWRAVLGKGERPPKRSQEGRPLDSAQGEPQGSLLRDRRHGMQATSGRPQGSPVHWVRLVAAGLLVAAFSIVVLPSYLGPYPASLRATLLGLQARSAFKHLVQAEAGIAAGDLERAWEELQPALAYRPDGVHALATAQVVLAEWQRARGDAQGALDMLSGLDWYQAGLLRGDILRQRGDLSGARAEFGARDLEERNPTGWAWSHLQPPAGQEVDLGGGLDLGLVDGFYQGEREGEVTYRWSGAVARLRFPQAGTGQPLMLRLHLRGWRPAGEPQAQMALSLEGAEVARLVAPPEWGEVSVPLPTVAAGKDIVLTLRTSTFLAGPRDLLMTGELRMLGVMVDRAKVSSEGQGASNK